MCKRRKVHSEPPLLSNVLADFSQSPSWFPALSELSSCTGTAWMVVNICVCGLHGGRPNGGEEKNALEKNSSLPTAHGVGQLVERGDRLRCRARVPHAAHSSCFGASEAAEVARRIARTDWSRWLGVGGTTSCSAGRAPGTVPATYGAPSSVATRVFCRATLSKHHQRRSQPWVATLRRAVGGSLHKQPVRCSAPASQARMQRRWGPGPSSSG